MEVITMAAFEFGNYQSSGARGFAPVAESPIGGCPHCSLERCECITLSHPPGKLCTEPILALKIYDSCRSKDCLTERELGPARDQHGAPVNVPEDAQSVLIENLKVARITVLKKELRLL